MPHHILQSALEHATRAPSAGFSQGWDFVVLRGEQTQSSGRRRRAKTARPIGGSRG
ncbi:nitroreductase family protein [Ornithinimicrobium sp. INDO-MA30-4]|uniref:nitroreductase family protein n=1 Tax=Ornithinimicrobium sp. INDO-MA30-4 TaxID=2908651 RepID=UPI0028832654|nr:nitroreductase family protein [Ornithinimicrobium sp. INDO-MA30-4]